MRILGCFVLAAALAAPVAVIRALTAEYGTAKILVPRSKDALEVAPDGMFDGAHWGMTMQEFGPAARPGDMIQITKVEVEKDRVLLEINHGIKGGRKWWHKIQVSGTGNRGTALGQNSATHAPGGTLLAIVFDEEVPDDKEPKEFLRMLDTVLDFEQRSATETYLEELEPVYREAIERNEVIVGMDRDMVLVAKDRPDKKFRDFKNGVETEDWIYGTPPGDVVFVTFKNGKVIDVKHEHANLGGEVVQSKPIDY